MLPVRVRTPSGHLRGSETADLVESGGSRVPSSRYRYGPPWPSLEAAIANLTASTGESACAVRFALAEAERYGGDPSNLTLFGHSVGANFVSVVAFADLEAPEGCLAGSGSVVPDNLVLHDGQWLIIDGSGVWDQALRRDSRQVLEAHTPWSYLGEGTRMPVHILDSSDPGDRRATEDMDRLAAPYRPYGVRPPEAQAARRIRGRTALRSRAAVAVGRRTAQVRVSGSVRRPPGPCAC